MALGSQFNIRGRRLLIGLGVLVGVGLILILGPFSDTHLADLSEEDLDLYERLLEENDQDLYQWASGQAEAPEALAGMLDRIMRAVAP